MPLSDAKIRSLKTREKPYKVGDFDGLFVSVQPNGSKLWRFKYRIDGKERVLSIGSYPAVSLAQARQTRDDARSDLAAGIDPSDAKRAAKLLRRESKSNTFEKLADAFLVNQRRREERRRRSPKPNGCLGWPKRSSGENQLRRSLRQWF